MSFSYVRHALGVAVRAAGMKPGEAAAFDHSFEGFYLSFLAAIVSLPFYIFLLLGHDATMQNADGNAAAGIADGISGPVYVAGISVVYIVDWLSMPLAMILLVRLLKADHRYVPFVVAYNWASVVIYAVSCVPAAVYFLGLTSQNVNLALNLAVFAFMIAYRWRLARDTLQTSTGNAAAIVFVDVLLGLLIAGLTSPLSGDTL